MALSNSNMYQDYQGSGPCAEVDINSMQLTESVLHLAKALAWLEKILEGTIQYLAEQHMIQIPSKQCKLVHQLMVCH